ncbi:MAG: hypothetical protein H0V81_15615 [Solirubrobacterales bacterium]|nr:hypothetical protein [Solirubrobacterales bacterium]
MGHADSQDQKSAGRFKRMMGSGSPRLRSVVIAAGIIGVVAAPVGVAATGDTLKEGVRNGTTQKETEIVSNIGSTTGLKGGYSTRQSNLSSSGGGAIYGCRSGQGGSAANPPQNPCVRANNLEQGYAFEFNATKGPVVGLISASGAGGDSVKPFITNATGVATGLNADRVDGANAADIVNASTAAAATDATNKADAAKTRFALVNEAGVIEEQSGGFTVTSFGDNANVYINAGSSLVNKGLNGTIAIQNRLGNEGANDLGPANSFNGQIAVARCNTAAVACAPAGTNNDNTIVVRATDANGDPTTAANRKRFYVTITP